MSLLELFNNDWYYNDNQRVSISNDKDKYTLEVELPGYNSMEIEKQDKSIVVSGEKKGKKVSDRIYYLSSEIADNVEKISGKYEMGILTIDMTKKRDSPSIKIKIL